MENRKVPMEKKQEERAVIESLFLEGRPGDKIAIPLHNVCEEAVHSRATAFR
jgi:hypothetical protein